MLLGYQKRGTCTRVVHVGQELDARGTSVAWYAGIAQVRGRWKPLLLGGDAPVWTCIGLWSPNSAY